MKRIVWLLAAALSWSSCSRNGEVTLSTEADSVAYVIGMNVGMNLLRMDSMLNVAAVCRAVGDVYAGRARFSPEQARAIYLRYVNYSQPERIRAYERQFLEDYVRTNRSYARTQSGLTYTVEAVGDAQLTPKSDRDTVRIRYAVRTADGRTVESSYDRGDTTRMAVGDLLPGVSESVRLVGQGGRINAWLPAALADGAAGNVSLGVAPNATLFYEFELLEVKNDDPRRR